MARGFVPAGRGTGPCSYVVVRPGLPAGSAVVVPVGCSMGPCSVALADSPVVRAGVCPGKASGAFLNVVSITSPVAVPAPKPPGLITWLGSYALGTMAPLLAPPSGKPMPTFALTPVAFSSWSWAKIFVFDGGASATSRGCCGCAFSHTPGTRFRHLRCSLSARCGIGSTQADAGIIETIFQFLYHAARLHGGGPVPSRGRLLHTQR